MRTWIRQLLYTNQSGFSLVELLIAMVVLVIAVTAFTGMLTSGMSGIARAGEKSTHMYLSQEELEKKISTGTTVGTLLTVTFKDLSSIAIPGETVEFSNGNVSISAFIPRR